MLNTLRKLRLEVIPKLKEIKPYLIFEDKGQKKTFIRDTVIYLLTGRSFRTRMRAVRYFELPNSTNSINDRLLNIIKYYTYNSVQSLFDATPLYSQEVDTLSSFLVYSKSRRISKSMLFTSHNGEYILRLLEELRNQTLVKRKLRVLKPDSETPSLKVLVKGKEASAIKQRFGRLIRNRRIDFNKIKKDEVTLNQIIDFSYYPIEYNSLEEAVFLVKLLPEIQKIIKSISK